MLKKNFFLFGLIMGLVLPVLAYIVLYYGGVLLIKLTAWEIKLDKDNILLISIFVNLFPMRYYFVSLKYENTGRGILAVTFVLGILYFIVRLA
ncbi:MAG: hypothetical protein K8S00_13970 [Bacteroidales bacterium]|nr:hypothetical protein [Bacteroidales bacterium]